MGLGNFKGFGLVSPGLYPSVLGSFSGILGDYIASYKGYVRAILGARPLVYNPGTLEKLSVLLHLGIWVLRENLMENKIETKKTLGFHAGHVRNAGYGKF